MADEVDDDFTNDDLDELDELDEEEEEEDEYEDSDDETEIDLDDGLPSRRVEKFQSKITTKEQVYSQLYNGKHRSNYPLLSKYELVRVLGVRAAMISDRAPTLVDIGDLRDPRAIAKKEFAEGKLPFLIRRPLPSKNLSKPLYEYRRIADLM